LKNKTAEKYDKQILRKNRDLRLVKLGLMKVSAMSQRELKQSWVDDLVANFDPDQMGNPEVSHRDGYFYIMDGQHRVEAVKAWIGVGWQEQHIQCWVAEGLTEEQEAETFLQLNNRKNVDTFQKFRVGLRAGRPTEVAIDKLVKQEGLRISTQKVPGAVACVGTLRKVYDRNGSDALSRTLRLARDSFGDAGFESNVIDGFGMLCHRYNGQLNEKIAVEALGRMHGGVKGLLGIAETLRNKTGNSKASCVAAAAVPVINRASKIKMPDWWKS
jgi:hypothetical protein